MHFTAFKSSVNLIRFRKILKAFLEIFFEWFTIIFYFQQYIYYNVPCPWLLVKSLRFLSSYSIPHEEEVCHQLSLRIKFSSFVMYSFSSSFWSKVRVKLFEILEGTLESSRKVKWNRTAFQSIFNSVFHHYTRLIFIKQINESANGADRQKINFLNARNAIMFEAMRAIMMMLTHPDSDMNEGSKLSFSSI